jgi:hypothetical protein
VKNLEPLKMGAFNFDFFKVAFYVRIFIYVYFLRWVIWWECVKVKVKVKFGEFGGVHLFFWMRGN